MNHEPPTPRLPDPGTRSRSRRLARTLVGLAFWIVTLGLGAHHLENGANDRKLSHLRPVVSWWLGRREPVRVDFPHAVPLRLGDPVVFGSSRDDFNLIGEVSRLYLGDRELHVHDALTSSAMLDLYPARDSGINEGSRVTLVRVPQTASWILRTLVPPEKGELLWQEWNRTLFLHREEIFDAIQPLSQKVLDDLQTIVIEDLPRALARREESLRSLGQKLQREVIQEEFQPILENELWPILARRVRPTVDAIGKEILGRMPLWALTWKYLYQNLPFTEEGLVREEWDRFVIQEVQPIIRSRLDDLFAVLGDVVDQSRENPRVAAAFRRALSQTLGDRELQHEVRLVFQEVILDNPRFQDSMARHWRSDEAAAAVDRLGEFMGPLLTRLGEMVLGSRGGGITPEFARVLRTQLLSKDRQWIWIEPGPAGAPPLSPATRWKATVTRDDD